MSLDSTPADHHEAVQADVVLVSMPVVSPLLPSIGLGLLHARLLELGISSRVFYFAIDFARHVSPARLDLITTNTSHAELVGEWLFSDALFEQSEEDVERFLDLLRNRAEIFGHAFVRFDGPVTEDLVALIMDVRNKVDPFLGRCTERVLDLEPRIVGFTSVFQQNIASLALAKRVKNLAPDTVIVFGGANCEGVMGRELMRQFDFIDAVVSGEGDSVFPEIVSRVLSHRPIGPLTGVTTRRGPLPMAEPDLRAHVVEDLDQLPDPNYDDFFEAHREAPLGLDSPLRLLFETSRGCWWGEKHHCTFCGLNGETMAYRSKSATHALNELRRLLTRYPDHPIEVVDNILDMRYFRDFLPELAQSDLKAELFYEVKSNLKKDQVRALRDAGVTRIQAGIESLSDSVLDLMRKGVSALQNIQLLKWGGEFGVKIQWNLLSGFPGEPAEEYERMSELVPSLTHLEPPDGCFNIRIDRFSPNFDEAGERGFTDVRPYPAYYLVYPFAPEAVSRLAYYFTYDYAEPRDVGAYTETLRRRIEQWSAEHARSVLASVDREEGRLFLLDTRSVAKRPVYAFDGLDRFLYASCDRIQRPASLCRTRASNGHPEPAVEEVRDRLDRFVEDRLMVTQDDRYLALAVGTSELEAI